ncbi:MAG TPA: antitoxin [Caulobacter sp.]|nr:antitoxin [Caulobacter sp.]
MAEPDPDIFDELEHEADLAAEAEADADIAAGRVVPHERVKDWLKSLGTPEQLPTPYSWRK